MKRLFLTVFLLLSFFCRAEENQVSTKEANPFKQTMWFFTEMHLNQAGPDDILFFGDSLVQGMDMGGLKFKSINMGIGGYSIHEITNRMVAVKLNEYRAIIMEGGINDILINKSDHEIKVSMNEMFRTASKSKIFYYAKMLPVNEDKWPERNSRIKFFNNYATKVCGLFKNCNIIESPDKAWVDAPDFVYFPDGVHLKKHGYKLWVHEINKNVKPKCQWIPENIVLWTWLSKSLTCSNF